jgi:hypothetical protein
MDSEGQRNLGRDIKANGLQASVIVYVDPDGRRSILDGRNRLDGAEYVGLPVLTNGALNPEIIHFQEIRGVDPVVYVLSANLHRRHLSTKDKRDLAGKLLRELPGSSDRQIAALVGISHHTVAGVRAALVSSGQIAQTKTRLGADNRRRPAVAPAKPPKSAAPIPSEAPIVPGISNTVTPPAAEGTVMTVVSPVTPNGKVMPGTAASITAKDAEVIATLARECRGLMSHPLHNAEDIRSRLNKIIRLADPDLKLRGTNRVANGNVRLNTTVSARAIDAMAGAGGQIRH